MPLPLAYGQQHIGGPKKKFLAANEVMDATRTHRTQGSFFSPLLGECWIFCCSQCVPIKSPMGSQNVPIKSLMGSQHVPNNSSLYPISFALYSCWLFISSPEEEIATYMNLDRSKLDLFYWMGQSKIWMHAGFTSKA
jgi:hypothetical protein